MKTTIAPLLMLLALMLAVVAGTDGIGWPSAELFWALRAPRLALAVSVGALLAVSGVFSQALLRNALAEPYVLGVSGGAALGGVLGALVRVGPWGQALAAVLGAWAAAALVFMRGRRTYRDSELLLQGVVFNAFAAALVTVVKTVVSASQAQEILFWLMGQLAVYDPWLVGLVSVTSMATIVALLFQARAFDALLAGDASAHALGVDVLKTRRRAYWWLSVGVGAAVSVVGLIGFVGLVVPHIARQLGATRHRSLMLVSAALGSGLMLFSDALCRLAFVGFGTELPVGVITAFLGAPFFVWRVGRRER